MSVPRAHVELVTRLDAMLETIAELRLTINDRPPTGDVALVDIVESRVDDVAGWIEEARAAVSADDGPLARAPLVATHELVNRVARAFVSDPVWYGGTTELTSFGRRRGGEWRRWTDGVQEGLARSRSQLLDVNDALLKCWFDLTAPVRVAAVSAHTGHLAFAAVGSTRPERSQEGG
jgi:hypothetical protein